MTQKKYIQQIIHDAGLVVPWADGDNIPWNDPEFSKRMLREHLSQEHDLASRRGETIGRQVDWIHNEVLKARPSRILDLCCGPGLYGTRLAELGHEYFGIDYSPASIEHALQTAAGNPRCDYVEGDVRQADYGSGYGLAMMIYGEFNVFRPADAAGILRKAHAALDADGLLLLEPHTHAGVVETGSAEQTWDTHESGLFSDSPYLCLKQSHWDEATQTATVRFFIIDADTAGVTRCAASYQAYTDEEYRALLRETGFEVVESHPSLTGDRVAEQPSLMTILVRKHGA